jgi:hypothetical protein
LVGVAYAAVAFLYFGWRLLPHPGRLLVGADQQNDANVFIWSFAWWPHAIGSWTNPFYTHVVYAPTGIDLAWVTSVPGLALAFSPVTLLFGPAVAYNLAAVLLPACSAFTAYLLCRYLTHSGWASLVGGYLYGFSSFIVAHEFAGLLPEIGLFLLPLAALALARFLRGDLGVRGLAWRHGVILGFQAYLSIELCVTLALAIAAGLLLAFVLAPDRRTRIRAALTPLAAGYALAGLLAAPLLYYALSEYKHPSNFVGPFNSDLLNPILPTRVTGLGGASLASITSHWPGGIPERGSYLGAPVLLMVALLAVRRRHATSVRLLLSGLLLATLLSLGSALYVNGHRTVWLPWAAISHLPAFSDMYASRLAVYATLAATVMVALWIASTPGRIYPRPYALPILAVAALVPPVWSAYDVFHPHRIAFFSDRLYKLCVPRNETLLIFPFGHYADSDLWQAESGFWFKMAEGSLTHLNQPASFLSDPTAFALQYYANPGSNITIDDLRAFTRRRHVDRVVRTSDSAYPSGDDLKTFGALQVLGDAFVAPACGHVSLDGDKRPAA